MSARAYRTYRTVPGAVRLTAARIIERAPIEAPWGTIGRTTAGVTRATAARAADRAERRRVAKAAAQATCTTAPGVAARTAGRTERETTFRMARRTASQTVRQTAAVAIPRVREGVMALAKVASEVSVTYGRKARAAEFYRAVVFSAGTRSPYTSYTFDGAENGKCPCF